MGQLKKLTYDICHDRPTIFDPSELRTDGTGKVVHYLQDNGSEILAGQPYVEVDVEREIERDKASNNFD